MTNRTLQERNFTVIKGEVTLYCAVSVAAAGAVTLLKWNYPTFGGGANARTYTAAQTGGGTSWPSQYQAGYEGVKSIARTAAGLWTLTLQDNYQRLVAVQMYSSLAGGLSAIVAIHENTTITNITSAGGSIVGLALLSATATALDPANGERINLRLTLQDATI